ncbi:MAG: DUF3800 domain-containing protein [Pseudonocardiales bacterium]|nr:DUF3800 domain-containing protein [Pseudonocardiales bacterium]
MLLTYIDESYTDDHYYIAALMIPEEAILSLGSALDAVVKTASRNYAGISENAELHAHDLVGGKGDWKILGPMLRARIGIYNNAIQAIADHEVTIVVRGVDITRLRARYRSPEHPHSIVLTHLIERVDEYVEGRDELALLIADEVGTPDEYRQSLWHYQRTGTWGYRRRQIRRIVDTLHFAPSKASRLVQAADMVAYLYRRRLAHVETDPRAERAWAATLARVEPRCHHVLCWRP